MKIYPINIVSSTKNVFSRIRQSFSPANLKTKLCDTFERITKKTEISSHGLISVNNIHIRDFLENPRSRFKTNPILRKPIEQLVCDLDHQFATVMPLEKEITVYRGRSMHPHSKRLNRDFEIIRTAKVGDIITPDFSYAYAEYTRPLAEIERARHISRKDLDGKKVGGIMYEIILPEGSKVSRGQEVAIPREAKYQILQKTQEEDGCTLVKMKYILPEK